MLYAHTSGKHKEPLDDHLKEVAELTRDFTQKFGAEEFGYCAGLLHDLGKAKIKFQKYMLKNGPGEPHAGEGARFVKAYWGRSSAEARGQMLAYVIAGHHSGLANGIAFGGGTAPLKERLRQAEEIKPWFDVPDITKPPRPFSESGIGAFGQAFFIRMLYSALVDADFLATERWFAKVEGKEQRAEWGGSLQSLKSALDLTLGKFLPAKNDLAILRSQVLADCRRAGERNQGLFSLTVPTGGGKTLSSLAFALEHCRKHNLDRVIYVIPFTSIVEQTAKVFREALNDPDAVLEHHSNFSEENISGDSENDIEKLRKAAQNWDRPIIVTTAVQFFESLYARRSSRCRKLHNIARSVVILDEAQMLPLKLLRPCLAALNELQRGYHTSIVLCTATQPALTNSAGLKAVEALKDVREIIQPDRDLFHRLKRVRAVKGGTLSDGQLVEAMREKDSALCIVNNRRHARELFEELSKADVPGAYHLTTAMTPKHRRHILDEIRQLLKVKKSVRLVSTSLIEAGVDISFDAVWRAWAGLDQIAQAAGRCNRENELGHEGGELIIFEPEELEGRAPPRELKQFADTARSALDNHDDPLCERAVADYFRELLWRKSGADQHRPKSLDSAKVGESEIPGIMKAIDDSAPGLNFCFADIAQAFRMIENSMVPVIIPETDNILGIGAPEALIGRLHGMDKAGGVARELQPYLVQVPHRALASLLAAGAARVVQPEKFGNQFVLLETKSLYRMDCGLNWDDPEFLSIEGHIF
jgi:CRISPR-associated endonuclease/helicase Cas3